MHGRTVTIGIAPFGVLLNRDNLLGRDVVLKNNLNCRLLGPEHGALTGPALLCQRPDHQVPDGHHTRELH